MDGFFLPWPKTLAKFPIILIVHILLYTWAQSTCSANITKFGMSQLITEVNEVKQIVIRMYVSQLSVPYWICAWLKLTTMLHKKSSVVDVYTKVLGWNEALTHFSNAFSFALQLSVISFPPVQNSTKYFIIRFRIYLSIHLYFYRVRRHHLPVPPYVPPLFTPSIFHFLVHLLNDAKVNWNECNKYSRKVSILVCLRKVAGRVLISMRGSLENWMQTECIRCVCAYGYSQTQFMMLKFNVNPDV